jgi:hypothetical protein
MFVMVLNSRINSWESCFIYNLQKININQYCNSIHGHGIHNHDMYKEHIPELMALSIIRKHTVIILYILERPSSWSTSRIRPSWPRSRLELSLPLVLFLKYIPCLLWPTQHLAVCSNGLSFTLNPFIADWVASH